MEILGDLCSANEWHRYDGKTDITQRINNYITLCCWDWDWQHACGCPLTHNAAQQVQQLWTISSGTWVYVPCQGGWNQKKARVHTLHALNADSIASGGVCACE
jgi:hypothetical protein